MMNKVRRMVESGFDSTEAIAKKMTRRKAQKIQHYQGDITNDIGIMVMSERR